jgi:hypothetical protein
VLIQSLGHVPHQVAGQTAAAVLFSQRTVKLEVDHGLQNAAQIAMQQGAVAGGGDGGERVGFLPAAG